MAALALAIGYSAYAHLARSAESRSIEAGLIESGDLPTIYFNLKNTGSEVRNYTYVVTSDSTEGLIDRGLILNLPPGETFHYTLILTRGERATPVRLRIYLGEEATGRPIYDQAWLIRGGRSRGIALGPLEQ